MPRQPKTYELDLFSNPHDARTALVPQWQALPVEMRQALTKLMVRLILDQAHGDRAPEREDIRPAVALIDRPPTCTRPRAAKLLGAANCPGKAPSAT